MQELGLAQIVAPYGDIHSVKIVRDKKTGKCKGYAFIEMISRAAAENVVTALNGDLYQERELKVSICDDTATMPVKPFVKIERTGSGTRPKRPRLTSR